MRAVRSVGVGTLAAWLWMLVALPASARHDEGPRRPEAREAAGGRAALAEAPALPIAPPTPWPIVSREVAADTLPGGAVPWAALMAPPALGALMQGGGGSGGGPTFEYYALDALGSVRVVFDAVGAVKARADYEPFGSPITASTTGPLPREQFTGQQRDTEVGLDYFGARFYHAAHGRMLSVDPLYAGALAEPQRWNRYAYALNSPLVMIDPDGRCAGPTNTGHFYSCTPGDSGSPMINTPSPGMPSQFGCGISTIGGCNYFIAQYGYEPDFGSQVVDWVRKVIDAATDIISTTTYAPEPDESGQPIISSQADRGDIGPFIIAAVVPGPSGKGKVLQRIVTLNLPFRNGAAGNHLLADAAAKYPKKAGRLELHHVDPIYMGGPRNGATVPLDAAYHQIITNAFRDIHPYGAGTLDPFRRNEIRKAVYGRYPLLPAK